MCKTPVNTMNCESGCGGSGRSSGVAVVEHN